VAEEDMKFSSSVDVANSENNELFNAVSVYVPLSLAERNIVEFNPAWVTKELPAVMTCVADNYAKIMQGSLLNQWDPAFRRGSNVSLAVYLIVFADDESTAGDWSVDDVSIRFKPLSEAFEKLFFVSFIKMMFDEDHDGSPLVVGTTPGTAATATFTLVNTTGSTMTISAGQYLYSDGVKDWVYSVDSDKTVNDSSPEAGLTLQATTVGAAAALQPAAVIYGDSFSPPISSVFQFTVDAVNQGSDPEPITAPSTYFDRSLALAYLCKTNPKLSQFWSLVRLRLSNTGFPAVSGQADPNACWIRSKTAAEQKAFAEAGLNAPSDVSTPAPRSQYYWGFLWQMGCLDNTWVVAHSEPLNLLTEILAAWFERKNSSGQYIGNKLSRLRLTGAKIKPFGFPSILDNAVNENDVGAHERLDAMNVGYLKTISDSTAQQSCVSSALALGGTPITATMIGAFVNYEVAQQCAEMITDTGTLTNPILTDEAAYGAIQMIVKRELELFAQTNGRLSAIALDFPSFSAAKTGRTELEAASSWHANYKDDLTKTTVSGGITAA
jgi:hypothetical protein